MAVKNLRQPCSLSNVSNPIGSEKSTSLEAQYETVMKSRKPGKHILLPLERSAEIRRQRFKLDYGKIRILVGWGHMRVIVSRPRRIVLLKVAYYATSSARNFAKLCQNYARIPKLCS